MTWYEWAIGGWQFVAAWWCTDRLTRKKGIMPDWAIARHQAREEARAAIINLRATQMCTRCSVILWESQPGLCKRCRGYGVETAEVYSALEAMQDALGAKSDQITRGYEEILRQQLRIR